MLDLPTQLLAGYESRVGQGEGLGGLPCFPMVLPPGASETGAVNLACSWAGFLGSCCFSKSIASPSCASPYTTSGLRGASLTSEWVVLQDRQLWSCACFKSLPLYSFTASASLPGGKPLLLSRC